jgi:hypothetical protein
MVSGCKREKGTSLQDSRAPFLLMSYPTAHSKAGMWGSALEGKRSITLMRLVNNKKTTVSSPHSIERNQTKNPASDRDGVVADRLFWALNVEYLNTEV